MVQIIAILILTAIDAALAAYDIRATVLGIHAGVAVEGNEFVTFFARTDKPSATFLYAWNFAFIALFAGLGVFVSSPVTFGAGIAVLVVDAVKHYQGGRSWHKLLNDPRRS